jgi:hypothetical protein
MLLDILGLDFDIVSAALRESRGNAAATAA